ncbi:MAG TPA: YraN family protein [Ignavibacteria bacterium]|nr:YraN family protein [Ignavibacteria bacterium]
MPQKKCIYKNRTGAAGEQKAKEYLINNGFHIVKSNYKYDKSEIDIICLKDNTLVFTEVKTRRNKKYGEPEESITPVKVKHIQKAAEGFLMENPEYDNNEIRFDVVTIMLTDEIEINHIENAF